MIWSSIIGEKKSVRSLGFKFWIIGIYRHFQQFFRYIVTIKLIGFDFIWFIVVNVTFSNILWQPVLVVEEAGVHG